MRRAALIAALTAFALPASAAVLYKAVDEKGVVMFSDLPPPQGVEAKRVSVPESSSAVPGAVRPTDTIVAGTPTTEERIRLGDEAVQRASAQVDLAEHALAVARASIVEEDPLSLGGRNLTRADRQQLEFYKKDVAAARRNLMRILHQRNTLTQRPFA